MVSTTHTHKHTHAYTYTYTYLNLHHFNLHTLTHIYIYIHLHAHTHTHIYIYICIYNIQTNKQTNTGNRVYIPAMYVLNKIDQISIEELNCIKKIPHCVPISGHHKWNFDGLLEQSWGYLDLMRM